MGHNAIHHFSKTRPKIFIRYDGKGASKAGKVIGFAGGEQGNGLKGYLFIKGGQHDVVLVMIKDKSAVDLVRTDNDIITKADLGQMQELLSGKDTAGGVLRVAEDEHPCMGCHGPLDFKEVEDISAAVIHMGDSDEGAL
jgi:hypothetical protein